MLWVFPVWHYSGRKYKLKLHPKGGRRVLTLRPPLQLWITRFIVFNRYHRVYVLRGGLSGVTLFVRASLI